MGLSINQNIAAVNSYRNLSNTQNDLSKSLEKLSSGFRINRAADDAAGLAISEGLRSQIGGLKVAVRNSQDGISVVQTAEGALTETHSILQRMRDLSVQAANDGGLSTDAKTNIQSEMSQMQKELTRIADTTQFNGTKLLDGEYTGKFQVGANVGETINVGVATSMGAAGLGVDKIDVTTAGGTGASKSQWLGMPQFFQATIPAGTTYDVSINGKTVTLGDSASISYPADIRDQINAAGTGVTAEVKGGLLELTSTTDGPNAISVSGFSAIPLLDDTGTLVLGSSGTKSGAENAITAIDAAIKTVSSTRADLGAVQNRFDHTVKNLNVAVENLSASESRIRDTDMASEMVNFTRAQILSQAGTAMLAQANKIPQGVLSLLQ
jgi:flagellin